LILRDFFKLKHWWIATLVLSATPAWFLHSRTAFETVLMVSFYGAGMYFYLKYRYDTPKSLYPALVFFGLAFYSYSPGQVVVVLTGLLLLVADFRYHWANRQVTIRAVGLLLLIVLPYLRFRWEHPNAIEEHLANLNSYWLSPMPLKEKVFPILPRIPVRFEPRLLV
jgi:4-amino-4-deoxy-L-arabinose transferase-like glycosyltransferase